jgi:hypothetical protein
MIPVCLILAGFALILLSAPIGLLLVFAGALGLMFRLVLPVARLVGEQVERTVAAARREDR